MHASGFYLCLQDEMDKHEKEVERTRKALQKIATSDAKVAAKLQNAEDELKNKLLKQQGWLNPDVHCEEVEYSAH